jgi:hypothetical protein
MRGALVLAAAAACAIPDRKYDPYLCASDAPPTTAPAEVAITGAIVDPYQNLPVANASVAALPSGFTATTDATGRFSGMLATGGVPSASYFALTAPGFVDAYYYPAAPIAGDLAIQAQLLLPEELAAIGSAAGIALGSNAAQLVVSVVDCSDQAVAGATIATDSGTVVYLEGFQPAGSATATGLPTGAAFVLNVSGSDTAVAATVDSLMFRNHAVGTRPGALTETEIRP